MIISDMPIQAQLNANMAMMRLERITTIGYREEQGLERIDALMSEDDSTILIDIRYSPKSSNLNWSQNAFKKKYGERYLWIKALGNKNYQQAGNIQIADPQQGIEQVLSLLGDHKVLLLCGCAEYGSCHRKVVYEMLCQALTDGEQGEQKATCSSSKIYVDDPWEYPNSKLPHKTWSHLAIALDGDINDLHEFAARLGLKREWFQDHAYHPHYDVVPSKRTAALKHGAIAVNHLELVKLCFKPLHDEQADSEQKQVAFTDGGESQGEQFNAEMAKKIITEMQEDHDRALDYLRRKLNDAIDENERLEEERLARLDAETRLAYTNKQLNERVSCLELENSKLLSRNTRLADEIHLYNLTELHCQKIQRNEKIDAGAKLTSMQYVREIIAANDGQNLNMPVELVLEDIAARTGQSSSTISRHNQKLEEVGALIADTSNKEPLENGKWKTHSMITLQGILDHPEEIELLKQPGGPRLRNKDGEALDTVSIDYSRSKAEAYLRMLPGQRADLDPQKIVDAIKEGRLLLDTYAHNRVKQLVAAESEPTNLKDRIDQALTILDEKQDAFEDQDSQLPTATDRTTVGECIEDEKQVAFEMPEEPKKICSRCDRRSWMWNEEKQDWSCRQCFIKAHRHAEHYFYNQDRLEEALNDLEQAARKQVDPSPWVEQIMTDVAWEHYISLASSVTA